MSERAPRKRRSRRDIEFPEHEWRLYQERARVYGLSASKYCVLAMRNFELSGMPLRLELPLPVKPWDPSSKTD